MATNLHQIKTLCFVFDPENDLVLLQQYGTGKHTRLHSGIDADCLYDENMGTSCQEAIAKQSGVEISNLKLRGVVKNIDLAEDDATIFFVYEAEYIHGELQQEAEGRLKWVEVLNLFNLKFVPQTKEIISHLLDGETFFEAFFEEDENGRIVNQEIHIA